VRAIGLFSGIGSALHEARALGFDIVGNADPRPRRHYPLEPWLWEANFPGSPLYADLDAVRADSDFLHADLAIGHPPCGGHSALGRVSTTLSEEERALRGRDMLATFTQSIRMTKPTVFAMENLPKILHTVAPPAWWERQVARYHLTYVHITNWDYGSVQGRKRLWVIGARKGHVQPFRFRPIARRPVGAPRGVLDALDGLPSDPSADIPELAHVHERPEDRPYDSYWVGSGDQRRQLQTVSAVARGFRRLSPHRPWTYENAEGRAVRKPGHLRLRPFGVARVMSGGPTFMHPLTGWPLTPRERARLMGWPDDFLLTDGRPLDRALRYKLAALTGRGVPSEFVRYLLRQLRDHLVRARVRPTTAATGWRLSRCIRV
jgi:site-specific DNA-cytosine methylase